MERELADEMEEHLAEKINQLRAEGCDDDEARLIARRQFGNMSLLLKTPAFTATAVLIFALGIGMNTAVLSAVKAVC